MNFVNKSKQLLIISAYFFSKEGVDNPTNGKGIRIYVGAMTHTVVDTRVVTNENAINNMYVLVFNAGSKLTQHKEASIFSNGEIYVDLTHTPTHHNGLPIVTHFYISSFAYFTALFNLELKP